MLPTTDLPLREDFLLPPLALRPVVEQGVLLTASAPVVRTLLPTFQVVLFINLGPAATLWPAGQAGLGQLATGTLLAGPLKTALRYRLPAGGRVLAVNLTLDGFTRLFGLPLSALATNGLTDPAQLPSGTCFATLAERLRTLPHPAQLLPALAAALPSARPRITAQAALLAQLPLLARRSHLNPLQVMAAAGRLSERTLQVRFREYLGFSAKEGLRFLRFRRVLRTLQAQPGAPDWLALAEQHGYYDQSHLIHDFAHFMRQPPTRVLAELRGESLCLAGTALLAHEPAPAA